MSDRFQSNLAKLRSKNPHWHQEALAKMDEWARQMSLIIDQKAYAELDITRKIVEQLKGFVRDINTALINDPKANREALIADKQRCLWLIRLLSQDFDTIIKDLEQAVESELQ